MIGTKLILKNDFRSLKKGSTVLYLKHCEDQGKSCIEAVVMDDRYYQILKNWGCYDLDQALRLSYDNSITPFDLNSFSLAFTTVKPEISNLCTFEDLLKKKERLTTRLSNINELIKLSKK